MFKHLLISLVAVLVIGYSQPASMQDVSSLPDNLQTITPSNVAQLQQVDQLGQGRIVETGWSPDSQRFAVVTTAGVVLYDVPNFDQPSEFIAGYTRLSRFSPDWSKVVMSTADMKTQLWDLATMTALDLSSKIGNRFSQEANITFTPDGKLLMLTDQDYGPNVTTVVWDVRQQQLYGRWDQQKGKYIYYDIQTSPNGHWFIAYAAQNGTAIWDITRAAETTSLPPSTSYTFSHNDRFLAWVSQSSSGEEAIHLRDMATGKDDTIFSVGKESLSKTHVLFTSDDRELIIYLPSQNTSATLQIWNIAERKIRASSIFSVVANSNLIGFSPDGRYLIGDNYINYPNTWDMQTAQPVTTPWQLPLAYTPNSKYVITKSQLWLANFKSDDTPLLELKGEYSSVSSDSHWLATKTATTIDIYDISQSPLRSEPVAILSGYTATYGSEIVYSPEGDFLLIDDQLLNAHTLKSVTQIIDLAGQAQFAIDLQGQLWLVGNASWGLAVWKINENDHLVSVSEPHSLRSILPGNLSNKPISISPDATYVAVARGDRYNVYQPPAIEIWNRTRDTQPIVVYGHQEQINDLVFSPNSRILASASGYVSEGEGGIDETVRLWRIEGGQTTNLTEVTRFYTTGRQVDHIRFSPDGRLIAATVYSLYEDNTYVWDTVTGKQLALLDGSFDLLTFSPDGSLLAVSDWSGAIHIFDTQSWREISVIYGHIEHLTSLQFRPDGQVLASSGFDGTVRLWGITD